MVCYPGPYHLACISGCHPFNGIYRSLWFGTGYTIADESLEIKYGPFLEKIPFSKIHWIKRTRALWSSASLSFDSLEIKHSYGITLISPLDSHMFINELKQ